MSGLALALGILRLLGRTLELEREDIVLMVVTAMTVGTAGLTAVAIVLISLGVGR